MKIILKVHLNIEDTRSMRGGEFQVKKEDDIPQLAHDWIRKIMMETGYRDTIIEKVVWNDEYDITSEVQELFNPVLK